MDDFAWFHPGHGIEQRTGQFLVERYFVPNHMDDDKAKGQAVQIVLVLEAAVDCHENVELSLNPREQPVIFEVMPSRLERGYNLVLHEDSGGSRGSMQASKKTRMPVLRS